MFITYNSAPLHARQIARPEGVIWGYLQISSKFCQIFRIFLPESHKMLNTITNLQAEKMFKTNFLYYGW